MRKFIAVAILSLFAHFAFAQAIAVAPDIGRYTFEWSNMVSFTNYNPKVPAEGSVTVEVVAQCVQYYVEYVSPEEVILHQYFYWLGYALTPSGKAMPGSRVRWDDQGSEWYLQLAFTDKGREYDLYTYIYPFDFDPNVDYDFVYGNVTTRNNSQFVTGKPKITLIGDAPILTEYEIENLCGSDYIVSGQKE